MIKTLKTAGLILLMVLSQMASAQTDKDKALEKAKEAIKLMDDGKVDESIKLLEEAQKLDPERLDYPYELAYAYYLQKKYKDAIKTLEKLVDHKNVNERVFQLLGNSYDAMGKSDKAFESYDLGLKKFPNSGMIYLEKGNVHWEKKEYGKALPYYEKGIEVDPTFPSNYYRATRIYCSSTEEVWGMIYGEIFMNLERNSKRTAEISKLLFDTYKSEITFSGGTTASVSFSKNAVISIDDIKDSGNVKLPFGIGVYEPTLIFSMLTVSAIDINTLDIIRGNFIDNYFKNGNDKKYPNILFTYQKQIKDAGHMEAYNHWILMKGDEEGFNKWMTLNKDKWEGFTKWFNINGLKLSNSEKFYSGQY